MGVPASAPPPPTADADLPADEIDRRVEASLAVLAGAAPADVAARLGVEVELVERWCDLFVAGGCNGVAGRTEASVTTRDRFLALAGHELMTPLTIVRGWSETLAATPDAPAEVVGQGLDAIARAAVQLERIARDALDAAAVALGRFRLVLDDVDLDDLLLRTVEAAGVEQVVLGDRHAGPAVLDPDRIAQVVVNLLANAAQHGDGGPVEVGATRSSSHVLVVVESGGTIDQTTAYELFEPWVRGPGSGGTGLGLYACRAIVSAHGGHIGVRGDEQRTQFWFRLPIEGPPAALLVERSADLDRPHP